MSDNYMTLDMMREKHDSDEHREMGHRAKSDIFIKWSR